MIYMRVVNIIINYYKQIHLYKQKFSQRRYNELGKIISLLIGFQKIQYICCWDQPGYLSELLLLYCKMNNKNIIPNSITFDNYEVTLDLKNQKDADITIRDNFKMQIYQAKDYHLNKINCKALETALRKTKKELKAVFKQTVCQNQNILEIMITLQMPLIPKTTQIIYIPKIKKLLPQQITNSKLSDIKNQILKARNQISQIKTHSTTKFYSFKKQVPYYSANKEEICKLNLTQGKFLITISGLMKTNASNYISVALSKADICPGTYYGTPVQAQTNPFAYLVKAIIEVVDENEAIQFSATNGTSYGFTFYNLLMTAQRISVN